MLEESDESGTIKILNISIMYLYTEFPDIGTGINIILWYFLREHNFELLNQNLLSWKIICQNWLQRVVIDL
jgi:hypothetical protein